MNTLETGCFFLTSSRDFCGHIKDIPDAGIICFYKEIDFYDQSCNV